jgi:hypothetical protein
MLLKFNEFFKDEFDNQLLGGEFEIGQEELNAYHWLDLNYLDPRDYVVANLEDHDYYAEIYYKMANHLHIHHFGREGDSDDEYAQEIVERYLDKKMNE